MKKSTFFKFAKQAISDHIDLLATTDGNHARKISGLIVEINRCMQIIAVYGADNAEMIRMCEQWLRYDITTYAESPEYGELHYLAKEYIDEISEM